MVNPWRKYQTAPKRQKQALHSLFAGLAFFFILYFITAVFKISVCPIKNLWGIPCPGCGLTRGFIAILHLDLKAATQHHILSVPLFIGIAIHAVLCFTDVLLGRKDLERLSSLAGKRYMLLLYLAILALSAYLKGAA